jgi:thiol:disulfide interchange protein DsbD
VLSSFADPSRIFGIWWVTLGLGLLIAIMSVGLMGVFNITLPQAVYAVNPKADSAGGSFLFGIMTAVLGLPCFGFVAGSLLAAAATLPKIVTFAIFLGLGVGMALPYFVLALKPHWIKKIPRTGPASELIKQVMGLLLLAAGIFFIGAGLIALVAAKPWIAKQLHVWIAALIALIAGLWIISRTFQISKSMLPRAIFTVIGLFVASAGLWYANDTTTRARDNYLSGMWAPYSPQAVAAARAEGKVVVLDFTAEWCLNCKALKAAVLDREPVKSRLREQNIALFLVDLTATEAPGWKRLEELGQTGIPLLAIYTPGEPQPWLANNYTADTVMAAVNRALQVADAARKASTETAQLPSGR